MVAGIVYRAPFERGEYIFGYALFDFETFIANNTLVIVRGHDSHLKVIAGSSDYCSTSRLMYRDRGQVGTWAELSGCRADAVSLAALRSPIG